MPSLGPYINLGRQPSNAMFIKILLNSDGLPEFIEAWTTQKEQQMHRVSTLEKPYPLYVFNIAEGTYSCLLIDQTSRIYNFPFSDIGFRAGLKHEGNDWDTSTAPVHPKRLFPIADKMLKLSDEQIAKLLKVIPPELDSNLDAENSNTQLSFIPSQSEVMRQNFKLVINSAEKYSLSNDLINKLISTQFLNDWESLKAGTSSAEEYINALRALIKGNVNDKNLGFNETTFLNTIAFRNYLLLDQITTRDPAFKNKQTAENARRFLLSVLQTEIMQFPTISNENSVPVNNALETFISILGTEKNNEETFFSNLQGIIDAYLACSPGAKQAAYSQLKKVLNPELMKVFDSQCRSLQDQASMPALRTQSFNNNANQLYPALDFGPYQTNSNNK